MERILSKYTASISELKKNPTALLRVADGEPIAILNHNRPAAYLVPAETYEAMLDMLEDAELARIVNERLAENEKPIDVNTAF
ncbi:MAG: type II toxin-antitoxin system prevent-host-death family antitoxin [Chloroflexi bacterium]|nr:type II toxin-antitoxin system prevent-host-death family antitoxin [Chloroflexota bacterium]